MSNEEDKDMRKERKHKIQHQTRAFRAAVSTWRKQAVFIETLLVNATADALAKESDTLFEIMNELTKCYELLEQLLAAENKADPDAYDKFDTVEEANYLLAKRVSEKLLSLSTPVAVKENSDKPDGPNLAGSGVVQGTSSELIACMSSLALQMSLNRLPPPEPAVFSGDPLTFPAWKRAFETLIERRGIPPSEQIHYLSRYVSGPAKECVEGFFYLNTDEAFTQAKQTLEKRFGDPYIVAEAFRTKLDNWPKVPSKDGFALRKLADFLKQCESAMQTTAYLNILNDCHENKKLLGKLPEWVCTRWGRTVADWKSTAKEFPPFRVFADFIVKEADIASDPITSLQALKEGRPHEPQAQMHLEKNRPTRLSFATQNVQPADRTGKCVLCEGPHFIDWCDHFLLMSMEDRKQLIRDKKLCYGCLKQGSHISRDCRHRLRCETCSKLHPTSLHGDVRQVTPPPAEKQPTTSDDKTSPASVARSMHGFSQDPSSKSTMILPVWLSDEQHPEKRIMCYAMLDTQSDTTFVLDSVREKLGIAGNKAHLRISTMTSENVEIETSKISGLTVQGLDCDSALISLPKAFTRPIMPVDRSHIPTTNMANRWPHLQCIASNIMPIQDCEVGLLIGYNCPRALAPKEIVCGDGDAPFAQKTELGWGIVGLISAENNTDDEIGYSHRIVTYTAPGEVAKRQLSFPSQIKEVVKVMEADFQDSTSNMHQSVEDSEFLAKMQKGIHQLDDGHYEMPLPFKGDKPTLIDNSSLVLKRLNSLKTKFNANPEYKTQYVNFMETIIAKGEAELAEEEGSDQGQAWFLPHFGVYHPKKPNKIRVVFDCSARYNGCSLNDHVLQGPDMLNSLLGVLCRFRQEPIAVTCDVERMYHGFRVNAEHRNYLKFWWWPNGDCDKKPVAYRMTVHIFGAKSSPSCCNFGLKQIATDHESDCGLAAANFVNRNFYVDDGLSSLPKIEDAIQLVKETQSLCSKGALRLHKFVSNSEEVLKTISEEDRAIKDTELKNIVPSTNNHGQPVIERALGVYWSIGSDTLQFKIVLNDRPTTRRGILSTIGTIYDPLGLVAPVLLVGKQILQELCSLNADWDSPLPENLREKWELWRDSLHTLEKVKVDRCHKPADFGEIINTELHHFSDASHQAYGQCSYVRFVNEAGQVHCSFIMGKARVAPLRMVTIPRLELTAAVLSAKVSSTIKEELDYKFDSETYWTDSKIVMGYIGNDVRRFHVFVANRVQQIREQSQPSQWRYIRSEDNPADEASRGVLAAELAETARWLKGPSFPWQSELPLADDTPVCCDHLSTEDPEVRRSVVSLKTVVHNAVATKRLERYSTWSSARKSLAICLNYKERLKARVQGTNAAFRAINSSDIDNAEKQIIRMVQHEAFEDEIAVLSQLTASEGGLDIRLARERNQMLKSSSPLYRLDSYVDQDGILRVGGRLRRAGFSTDLKHPVILPKKHHVTELLIAHHHQAIYHQGRGMTISRLRDHGIWIIGCRSAVSSHISKCVPCRKLRCSPQVQKMADLPLDRLEAAPPFQNCGVDLFGPWIIRVRNSNLKRYGVLFTCLASRAIHIETTDSLETDSFINAIRRLIALRGPVVKLRCDRGTNFIGAEAELKKAAGEMDVEHLRHFLMDKYCCELEFKFNVPSASHMGGVWERQIRSIRNILMFMLNDPTTRLDDDSLRTFMHEAAAIVNSRPLTTDNLEDPKSLAPLTPNHILTMKSNVILPPPGNFTRPDLFLRKRWCKVQFLATEFWNRWRREYLQNLQPRQKWTNPTRDVKIGDVMVIKDDNAARNLWRLGRVVEVNHDQDGHVRSAKLMLADPMLTKDGKRVKPVSYLERPIHKLVLILEMV